MITFIKKPVVIIITIVLIIGIGFFIFSQGGNGPSYDFVVAERGDIIQEVSVTGRVTAAESVELAFEKTGRISRTEVDVGDHVSKGQKLLFLENSDTAADLAQAEANVKIQQAKLNELLAGSRLEEIEVQKVKVENARAALTDSLLDLIVKMQDAFTKSDDAVRNKVDQFISGAKTSSPDLTFQIADSSLEISIESGRFAIESTLVEWKSDAGALSINSDTSAETIKTKNNLSTTKEFLEDVSLAVNSLKSNSALSQATIDGYRADVSTARTNVNTAISAVVAAEESVQDESSALLLEEQELSLVEAPTRPEQILAQEAKLEEARATVSKKKAELAKTILYSPISGIVTVQDAKVGEIVSANSVVVSLISTTEFEIEANVPEADIAKIAIGDFAKTTLDAYDSDIFFDVVVVSINPAETIIEGVATYKTTFQFSKKDNRVKSGMTANIDIVTGVREGVIAIPARAVVTQNGDKWVRIVDENNVITESPVVVGLRGSDGRIEILEGVNEGDSVITFIEK